MSRAPRIVSLVPSLTELLFELDLGEQLVGRTGFCIHPREAVRAVPKVGGTKDVDIEAVLALEPTHLVVNVDENEKPTVDRLARDIEHIVVTHPLTAHDNLALYAQFGQTFDRVAQAARLAQRMQAAIDRARARQWAPLDALYLIWKSPWMTVSNETYISDMLAQVGLKTIAPESTRRYPEIDWQDFPPSQADLVLFSSEPYRFRDHDAREFATEHRLAAHRCLTIDGEISSWYGPRAIGGLDALVRLRESIDAVIAAAEAPRR